MQLITVLIEKRQDWNATTTISPRCMPKVFPRWILLIQSRDDWLAISQGNANVIVTYLADLTFQSSTLFNIGTLIASILFGKILTNFIENRPGVAGFRVTIPTSSSG
jgi:hypothetical protein